MMLQPPVRMLVLHFSIFLQVEEIEKYFNEQVGEDLPKAISDQLFALKTRIMSS